MERITKKVIILLTRKYNKIEFSDLLGISRPTLDARLTNHKWKKTEVSFIDSIAS